MRLLDSTQAFASAVRAARAVIDAETAAAGVRPSSRSRLLSHGTRTSRAVLLLHGYTHGPEQMGDLAQDFHDRGYNVWVPRGPGHGTTDPHGHRLITTDGLLAYASEALDVAAGLGDEVGVVGISAGAVLAIRLAQQRDAVRRLLLLSPFFGPARRQAPGPLVRPLVFLYGRGLLPDRVTSRGYSLAAVSRYLGIVRKLPSPPQPAGLRSMAVVISSHDDVVDTVAATAVPSRIADAAGIPLRVRVLPTRLGLGHDTLALAGRLDAAELREQYIQLYEEPAGP
jgi:pimeloyl-ACP methyl ester carboxylesterase